MEPKISVELTAPEANALLQLLDIACRARGMDAAEACVLLSARVRQAAEAAKQRELAVVEDLGG